MLEIMLLFVGISTITAMVIGKISAIEGGDYTYTKKRKFRK